MENKEIFSKSALKALIIPLLVEQVLAVTVGLSDVMMVSNVGEAAISGVSLVDMINNLMIAIFAALATGGAVVTAQCIGARHYEEARKSAKQLIIVAITLSIVIMAGCLIFNRHILRILSPFDILLLSEGKDIPSWSLPDGCSYPHIERQDSHLPAAAWPSAP